ncbi:hypothetical protein EGH22_14490 [Halomicroarcula sp. F28]|uniref:hypothetical protein n=1 Tax=Haloarcula salinisoli TaxID=2487746 RepID=UPI001C72BD95|nr:hypothetical protein [Halomicroarcula salinisoli]MBX0287538.1 hypothetical protein [Halomicroarcula salinisoli]
MSGTLSRIATWIQVFLKDYLSSLPFKITGPVGTVFWILSGISEPLLAIIALLIHTCPPVIYYLQYRPFGIRINSTPTKLNGGNREPDKIAEKHGAAKLANGQCTIHLLCDISDYLDEFSIRFSTPEEIEIELRDIPCRSHIYDRKKCVLQGKDIEKYNFSIVLEVYDESGSQVREYPLRIYNERSGRVIEEITLKARY